MRLSPKDIYKGTFIAKITSETWGTVYVFEDHKYGDEEPFVVFTETGRPVDNCYYDLEDIRIL